METRFTRPGSEAALLNSQAAWVADQLRAWHASDLAAVSAAETISAQRSKAVEVPTLAFAECRAILSVLTSERVRGQPQPQEQWRLERLRQLIALELGLRDSAADP